MDRWCAQRGVERGWVMPAEECWQLARRWYRGRLDADWRGRSAADMETIFRDVGLDAPFWRLEERR